MRSYRYALTRDVLCPPLACTIVVRNGRPAAGTPASSPAQATVPRLFRLIQRAIDAKVARLSVRYGTRGVPRSIYIDTDQRIADEESRLRGRAIHPAETARALASSHRLERRHRGRWLRRLLRRPHARAAAAAAQRAHPARQRRELHALHAAAAGRRGRHARAAPRRRAAARAAARGASTCASGGSSARRRSATRCRSRTSRATSRTSPTTSSSSPSARSAGRCRSPASPSTRRGFKSLPEAIALRNHVLRTLEHAETLEDGAARREFLTYVFVGAGYAGLEGLAELQDFVADILDLYPRCRVTGIRWILVEAGDARHAGDPARSSPTSPSASCAAAASRSARTRRSSASPSTTPSCPTASRCRRARSSGPPASSRSRSSRSSACRSTDRGRIVSDAYMQVPGFDNVWAIGDCAAVPDPARKGEPCPPTAQHAIRQGRVVARNVAAALGPGGRKRALPLQDEGRVRRHGPPRGGRDDRPDDLERHAGVAPRADATTSR